MKSDGCVRLGARLVLSALLGCAAIVSGAPVPSAPAPVSGGDTLFADDFESGTLDAWQDGVNPSFHRVVTGPDAQSGKRYLAVRYPAGGAGGGWLTRFFMPGYQSLYVSVYVRFPAEWSGGTKLVGMYGSRTDNQWSGLGKAGVCPKGTDFFDAMLITDVSGNPGPLRFYTYYPEMAREPGGGAEVCWGRYGDKPGQANYASTPALSRDTWHRIEFFVELNTPGHSDGQQAFWVDGTQGAVWPKLRLRDSDILRLNAVQLSFSAMPPKSQELFVDSIEVRTARR
jgi:Polysaccharide lyase 14